MKIGQRLLAGFIIIILINVVSGALIINNINTVEQYYHSKKAMDSLNSDLKDGMLIENEFRSAYDTGLVVSFQLEYRNITRDIYNLENSGVSYGDSVNFSDMESSVSEYHDLVLNNNNYLYSLENLWRTEQSMESGPGGITDSSGSTMARALELGMKKNDTSTGMQYIYDMDSSERNFLSTHDASYLADIYNQENLTLAWSGNDSLLAQDIWRYNNNIATLSELYREHNNTNTRILAVVDSLGEKLSSMGAAVNGQFDNMLNQTMVTIISLLALSLVSSFAISIVITRSISKPIESLAQTSERIARGDMKAKIDVAGNDEVGRLAASIQKMIKSMIDRIEFSDALVRNIVDAQIIVDMDGSIFYLNDAVKGLTGYGYHELAGRYYKELLEGLPELSGVKSDMSCKCTLIKKGGARVNAQCRLSIVNNSDGTKMGTMVMIKEERPA